MNSFFISTIGCQMNEADSLKLSAGLSKFGLEQVETDQNADLVVINTCAVRQHAEERAFGQLGNLTKRKKDGHNFKLAVMGCMVSNNNENLQKRFPMVDVWAKPQEFDPIIELMIKESDISSGEFWPETFGTPKGITAFVPVIHGCNKICTYCIVPLRRGREISREPLEIIHEIRHLAKAGIKEVTLVGQTVEAYGKDIDQLQTDLADIFEAIETINGIDRVRFLTSYPVDMTKKIIDSVLNCKKVCEHFLIPVQSGSESMLKKMRRGYSILEFKEKVDLIREVMPRAAISTDIIVGFPGETKQEFEDTVALIEQYKFDKVHIAAYSPRPGTYAYRKLADDIPMEIKKERLQILESIQKKISIEKNTKLINSIFKVLVEKEEDGKCTGRTTGNQLVHFNGNNILGSIVEVQIHEVSPWSLKGILANSNEIAII
jgi:tRNA-2-methylthio-N6-dimethylallyladenosine synthase